ncbi:DUF3995 domain-containing protein [Chryseobacterium phosphatilyticum]|uniref:DUF3995 domain-containing protein n=1 Tax=Chryseobacterium phosphatilyticum TaxID=475075 RepID=A0A316X8U2_9FLAO|nr:DUF3995 domain-containing protein [Chryseobacterium phosphatilyticum]PWN70221.1 DUF3995 domain-containing protein [Chryseobacterium phosphatilyticum]
MNLFCNFTLTLILASIAIIHIYWAFGGSWGKQQAVPTTPTGVPLFAPGFVASFGVGAVLTCFIILVNLGNSDYIPQKIYTSLLALVALIFLIRSIGDFKYVGFFKKVNETNFARLDKRYYSPLCLTIFILFILKIVSL